MPGRRFSATVPGELLRLREVLAEARSRGCTFYLVEVEPGERIRAGTPSRTAASRGHEGAPGRRAPKAG
jgi:hypothetical protein